MDYTLERKPAWYAVRRVYAENLPPRMAGYPDTAWHWPCSHQGVKVRIDSLGPHSGKLIIESKVPLHRLWLEGDGLTMEDNCLDLEAHREYRLGFGGPGQQVLPSLWSLSVLLYTGWIDLLFKFRFHHRPSN